MEALKLIGTGHKVLLVRDDLAKLVDLGSIFSSAPKKEYMFFIKDISKVDVKKPTSLFPGSIRIQGNRIAPALQNDISVFFAGEDNYKIAVSMQQHIMGKLEFRMNPVESPLYSVFQDMKKHFAQTELIPGNYINALNSINAFFELSNKISYSDFDAILNYEKGNRDTVKEVGTEEEIRELEEPYPFEAYDSFSDIFSNIKSKVERLNIILPSCEEFNELYDDIDIVDISTIDPKQPVRLNLMDMPEIKPTPVKKGFSRDYLTSFVVIDAETTGLHPESDHIVELSAIRFDDFEPVEAFSTFVKPPCSIPKYITEINHISNAMVSEAPTIESVLPAFSDFCKSLPLVGHKLSFDLKFLFVNGFDLSVKRKYFDTLIISRGIKDLSPENYKLDTVCGAFGIYRDNAHRALSDCLAAGLLFDKMTWYITAN